MTDQTSSNGHEKRIKRLTEDKTNRRMDEGKRGKYGKGGQGAGGNWKGNMGKRQEGGKEKREEAEKRGKESKVSTLSHIYNMYRVFIKYCVFSLKKFDFLNSLSSAAALVLYLPGVCTHTDTEERTESGIF